MKTIRVGILGAGFTAGVHSRNLLKISGVEVAAICDPEVERAKKLATSLHQENIRVYLDFSTMLNSECLDVVYICIPPYAHGGEVEIAASKGIHAFIEKPISIDIGRAESMVQAVKKAGVYSRVGYHMRTGAAVRELKRMIDGGTAGIPTLYDGRYDCNSLHSPWWRELDKSGGQVFEQAIHAYDMAMYLLGIPENVSGFLSNLCHREVPGYTVEDTSTSAICFTSGALASISASNCAVPLEWNNHFTVVCGNVTVHFDTPNKAEFIYTDGQEVCRKLVDDSRDMYFEETSAFIAEIRGEKVECCSIEEGLRSLYLVDAVTRSSAEGGKPIAIKGLEKITERPKA